jgi:hypothetical protein
MKENRSGLPEALAVFARPFTLIVVCCPLCNRQHHHSVMNGRRVSFAGERVAPCSRSGEKYWVRWNGQTVVEYCERMERRACSDAHA